MHRVPFTIPCVVAAVLAASAAGTAGAWEAPVAVSRSAEAVDGPYLAVNAAGDAVLAWGRYRSPTEEEGLPGEGVVEATVRTRAAQNWVPATLTSPPEELATRPVAGFDATGGPVVAWTTMRRGVMDVTGGEATGGPTAWTTTAIDLPFPEPQAATMRASGSDGTIALAIKGAWPETALHVWMRAPGGGWSEAPSPPAEASETENLAIAVRDGRPVLAWLEATPADRPQQARTRLAISALDAPGAAWGTPRRTPYRVGWADGPQLLALTDGTLIAYWGTRAGNRQNTYSTLTHPDGTQDPTVRLPAPGAVAPGPGGTAVWAQSTPLGPAVWIRSPQGAWSRAEGLAGAECIGGAGIASLAMGPSGEVVVVETAGDMGDWGSSLRAWVRDADGHWARPVWLSTTLAGGAVTAIDGAGRIHAAWWQQTRTGPAVRVTTTTAATAGTMPGMREALAGVSGLTVRAAGGRVTVRFRTSRPGTVQVTVTDMADAASPTVPEVRFRGRTGLHVLPLTRGAARLARGRWRVRATPLAGFLSGCPVISRPFVVR